MPDDRYKNYRINIPREPAYSEWTDSPWLIENINDNYIYVDLGTSVSDSEQDIKRSIPAYIGAIVRLEKCNNIFAPDKPGYYILLDEGTQFIAANESIPSGNYSQEYMKHYFKLKAFW